MKRNSRLSLALHTLSHMAEEPERVRSSAHIADHAGTNPVVVRRVLGKLREAGLLYAEKGQAGGWGLAKRPAEITLADIYLALDGRLVAGADLAEGPEGEALPSCSLENALQQRVHGILDEIEQGLIARLSETTLAEIGHPPKRV